MEIIVYDRNLYRLGTIENHTSLQWHRKYYECGTFELHAPATEDNIRLLQPGNVIRPKGKDEAAVIRGDQTEEESTLVNEIVRNGYFLPIYFNDRLTGPMFTFNGTCEDAMRFMINRMAAVPLLEVAPGIGDATKITFQATYKNVLTYLSKIARYCELGFRVVPDFKGKKMTFETYKGIDRTTKQGTKPRVIFSESYNKVKAGNVTTTVKSVEHIEVEKAAEADQEAAGAAEGTAAADTETTTNNNQTKHTILTLSKAIAADAATIGIPAEVTFYDRLGITEEEVEQMKGELA